MIRLQDLVIDDDLFEIRVGGVPVSVAPKVFDAVRFLAVNRHRVVTRAELLAALWPNVTVSDDAVTQTIRKARCALAQAKPVTVQIRTVRGRGYRLQQGQRRDSRDLESDGRAE